MKFLIFGATGRTGTEVVKQALQEGHEVTVYIRNPLELPQSDRLHRVQGELNELSKIEQALQGQDVVISALGHRSLRRSKMLTEFMIQLLPILERLSVKKFLYVSAYGAGDSRADYGWLKKMILLKGILKNPSADHDSAEKIIFKSSLDWVVARPGQLTDGVCLGRYQAKEKFGHSALKISRADVAHFLLQEIRIPHFTKKAVGLGY